VTRCARLLPSDFIIVRKYGDEEAIGEWFGGMEDQQGHPSQVGGLTKVSSSLSKCPGAGHTKMDA
jgi:hypothetical protein